MRVKKLCAERRRRCKWDIYENHESTEESYSSLLRSLAHLLAWHPPHLNVTGSVVYNNDSFPSESQSRRNIELVHEAPGKAPASQFLILVNC